MTHLLSPISSRSGTVMLLCLSSGQWGSVFEEAAEAAGEVALEAAVCLASCLAFLDASLDVGDRFDEVNASSLRVAERIGMTRLETIEAHGRQHVLFAAER